MKSIHFFHLTDLRFAVRKRTLVQWAVYLLAFWPFLIFYTSLLPGAAAYLKYLPDGILLILFLLALKSRRFSMHRKLVNIFRIIGLFFAFSFVVYVFRFQSIAYFLWGTRNIFRFFIAFFMFIIYLDEFDAEKYFNALEFLFWSNAVLSFVQFFVMGERGGFSGDFLGGIFGTAGGTNGYTTIFLFIVVGKSLLDAFGGRVSLTSCIIKSAVSCVVAAMAEIKFFYGMLILLLLGASLITQFSGKKVAILTISALIIMIGTTLLANWFGGIDTWTWENLWDLATKDSYSSGDDVNRLSAIASLSKTVIPNRWDQVFGLGLGNCDTSAFDICNSTFYQRYGHLHYTWFTAAMIFLETGIVGLGIYISFFVTCGRIAYKQFKAKNGNLLYNQLAVLMSGACIILMFYNSTLRIESAYMIYFILALPFIGQKGKAVSAGRGRRQIGNGNYK